MAELLTATATAIGGRAGHVKSSDGMVDVDLTMPKSAGGEGKAGATNPEALFASGYAACFGSAVDFVAQSEKVALKEVDVTAAVTLHRESAGFQLSVKLSVSLPGVDRATAERLVNKAHEVCPYSKATRNNIQVSLEVK